VTRFREETIGNQRLILGDCLEVLPSLEAGSVDAVITDCPYGVSVENACIKRGAGTVFEGGDINLDFGAWDRDTAPWQSYVPTIVKVLGPVGVFICFHEKLTVAEIGRHLSGKDDFQVRHIGAYVKTNPAPQARRVKWQNGLEFFLVATRNHGEGHHFNYRLGQSPDYYARSNNYPHEHPTQKPEDLMKWIVSYWSFPGDLILDPFLGSGTTLVAAELLGRRGIGIEIEERYFDIACKRVADAASQPRLPLEPEEPAQELPPQLAMEVTE